MVNGVTKSSGQGSTGVLAPIREWPPGGWRGKRGRGRDSQGSQGAPLTGFGDEKRGRQIREKLKGSCGLVADKKELNPTTRIPNSSACPPVRHAKGVTFFNNRWR